MEISTARGGARVSPQQAQDVSSVSSSMAMSL